MVLYTPNGTTTNPTTLFVVGLVVVPMRYNPLRHLTGLAPYLQQHGTCACSILTLNLHWHCNSIAMLHCYLGVFKKGYNFWPIADSARPGLQSMSDQRCRFCKVKVAESELLVKVSRICNFGPKVGSFIVSKLQTL